MTAVKPDVQAIFDEAIAQESAEQRVKYLDEACANHPEVRARVEALLLAHSEAGGFFGGQPAVTEIESISEKAGTQIGPYKLLQQIGEGGMGVVYMAEQTEPFERRVALKIIKPGMDSKEIVARFEAERQALAMMDHPNIAKVLDADTTQSGRPYFVMELVKGIPITEYCDQHRLTTNDRLRLFALVVHAVQHAHHKGIIHRDLKPSNVMVAEYDDRAVPKIIDFGVAKATGQKLTEKTMFTQYGQLVGTLEYMSPEQAKLNQLDVDTRSDIYSLGVLLYELLTGNTPIDKERLRSAAFDEMLRIIREEEPPRPSVRLTTAGTLAAVANNRRVEPKKLTRLVRGELDWIVMKALEKDRTRRYETAASFADDVERYLNDQSVEACPPTMAYRLSKFARRNKAAFAGIILLLLLTTASIFAAARFHAVAVEKDAALDKLSAIGISWWNFSIPAQVEDSRLDVYSLTSEGQKEILHSIVLEKGTALEGRMIMYDVGKENISVAFEMDGWSQKDSFPNPGPMQTRSDGSIIVSCGYNRIPNGSHISPGDDLVRFLPSGKVRPRGPQGEMWEGDVIISFGLRQ